jgi:hypothetical protein
LIAAEREQTNHNAGSCTIAKRRAIKRAGQQPQRKRHIGHAHDLTDVLDSRRRRSAEAKHKCRDQRTGHMPAPVTEERNEAHATGEQHREWNCVRRLKTRRRHGKSQQEVKRREDQRLRIGNLRPPAKDMRRPEWRLAFRKGCRQELELRMELRLRVPRNRDVPR